VFRIQEQKTTTAPTQGKENHEKHPAKLATYARAKSAVPAKRLRKKKKDHSWTVSERKKKSKPSYDGNTEKEKKDLSQGEPPFLKKKKKPQRWLNQKRRSGKRPKRSVGFVKKSKDSTRPTPSLEGT